VVRSTSNRRITVSRSKGAGCPTSSLTWRTDNSHPSPKTRSISRVTSLSSRGSSRGRRRGSARGSARASFADPRVQVLGREVTDPKLAGQRIDLGVARLGAVDPYERFLRLDRLRELIGCDVLGAAVVPVQPRPDHGSSVEAGPSASEEPDRSVK